MPAEPLVWSCIEPVKLWRSSEASPNIFEPIVLTILEVTIEDVKLVTVKLATVIRSAVTVPNVTSASVATSWPIAISLAFTVIPVPCPTAISLVAAIVPPPVNPAPAVIETPEWSICSLATKFDSESWSIVPWVAVFTVPVNPKVDTISPLELILPEAVMWLLTNNDVPTSRSWWKSPLPL